MFFKLFLIFIILPIIELALLIKIGTVIGVFNTISIIIITALAGSYMVKMEGLGVIRRFQENLSRGIFPSEELIDGAFVIIAGAFLITPGILTDITGFLFVFPPSRNLIKERIKIYLKRKIDSGNVNIFFGGF